MTSRYRVHGNMCYSSKCVDGNVIFKVGDKTYKCTQSGQKIEPAAPYNGYVICPDLEDFCEQDAASCTHDCSLNGRCQHNNRCYCYPGFKGMACETEGDDDLNPNVQLDSNGKGDDDNDNDDNIFVEDPDDDPKPEKDDDDKKNKPKPHPTPRPHPKPKPKPHPKPHPETKPDSGKGKNDDDDDKDKNKDKNKDDDKDKNKGKGKGKGRNPALGIYTDCPYDCYNRGKCYRKSCRCYKGYWGIACQNKKKRRRKKKKRRRRRGGRGFTVVTPNNDQGSGNDNVATLNDDDNILTMGDGCPYNCYYRGKCYYGRCRCFSGYTGRACQFRSSSLFW